MDNYHYTEIILKFKNTTEWETIQRQVVYCKDHISKCYLTFLSGNVVMYAHLYLCAAE